VLAAIAAVAQPNSVVTAEATPALLAPEVLSHATPNQPTGESLTAIPLIENYLPVSMLTVIPSPIDSVDPTPAEFRLEGVLGEIELMLLIASNGEVDAVLVVRSSLPEPFMDYATKAFKKARFTPGMVQKMAVRSRIRVLLSPNPLTVDPETGNPLSAKNRRR
jgi:outer membrane biosynthesis protein TonB